MAHGLMLLSQYESFLLGSIQAPTDVEELIVGKTPRYADSQVM